MKPTMTLTPALRTAIGQFVARLPAHVSMGAGMEPENEQQPYFLELRLTSSGFTRARERITFESEEQMLTALLALEKQLGLPPVVVAAPRPTGFSDLHLELSVLGTTASIAS